MTKAKKKSVAVAKRDPGKFELEAIEQAKERVSALPRRLELVGTPGVPEVEHNHPDALGAHMFDAFATTAPGFVNRSLQDVANVVGNTPDRLTQVLAIIKAINPQDELESALAQQMAACHVLAMKTAGQMNDAGMLPQYTAYGNMTVKLQRTFTAQLEALTKLRSGGEQVVRHIHVNVADGGQAVVANELHTGGGNPKIAGQPYGQGALGPAMRCENAPGHTLPSASDQGAQALPDTRLRSRERSAAGKPERANARATVERD